MPIYNNPQISKGMKEGMKLARLQIIAPLFKKGYSYRQIQAEVMARLDLKSYSLRIVKADIDTLLDEWRKERIDDVDKNLQLELTRIDDLVKEAWDGWEKSKQDFIRKKQRRESIPNPDGQSSDAALALVKINQDAEEVNVNNCGDVKYIETINHLLQERRKLLGLYMPEKREISGGLTFADAMMQAALSKANKASGNDDANGEMGADGKPVDWSQI